MHGKNKNIVVVFMFLCLLTACTQERADPIKIGWIGPLTGQSAVLGMDSAVAAQIAVDEINSNGGINNRKVMLIIEDDQYDISQSLSAYQKLVHADGAKIIIVNTYGSVFALAERAKEDGVLLIDPLDCNGVLAGLGDNVFCLATDSESIGEVLAEHAQGHGVQRVGILYWNSDAFMPLVKDVFVSEFDGNEITKAYTAGTNDFRTDILKMQEQGIDALVLLGYDETGNAMKQARDLGFEGQFYTTGTITSPSLQSAAQGDAEGAILAFWAAPKDTEKTRKFIDDFTIRQSRPPILDLASYPTYDAVHALALAIEKAGTDGAESVGNALLSLDGFEGTTGTVRFAPDGSMRIRENAYVLKNGTVTALD